MTDWLAGHGCHGDAVDDLVYALNEAVTNSVEHAFSDSPDGVMDDGIITMDATLTRGDGDFVQVVISVSDTGRWRPPPVQTGTRGRGLFMMKALVEDLRIDSIPSGTRVQLFSNPCWCDTGAVGEPRQGDRPGCSRKTINDCPPA